VLNPCPAGTAIYILACLCPDETAVLDILRLDLSQTHHHKQLPGENYSLKTRSSLDLFVHLKTYTHIVPTGVYRTFWLELVRSWLLTCPIDPELYREDDTGKELFCQALRCELIDRILKLD
jgi:hypothetical protein